MKGGKMIDFAKPFLIAGPCVIESYKHLYEVSKHLNRITKKLGLQWILKASYDKANRSSIDSFRGLGIEAGISHLHRIKQEFGCPITTDFHSVEEIKYYGTTVDLLQIPAFLCRQTDLLTAAAHTYRPVNVKKGQFISTDGIHNIVRKLDTGGCPTICVTERGNMFGGDDVVVDFRRFGLPNNWVDILDVTHTVKEWRDSIPLAMAGVALGLNIFAEVGSTQCDADRSIPLSRLDSFLDVLEPLGS